jgi:hypothetical protein
MSSRVSLRPLLALSGFTIALLTSSCGVSGGPMTAPYRKSERALYKWYDDGGEGRVSIRISLTDQIADIKRGDRDTHPGSYSITEKIVDKHSNIYGWFEDGAGNVTDGDAKAGQRVPEGMVYVPAPMPYWMRLTSYGVGMHGGLIPEPGKPASHGCIRMPKEFAPMLFDVVNVGTPVTITNAPSNHGVGARELHQLEENWTPYRGATSADSVTYRDGKPVSYR